MNNTDNKRSRSGIFLIELLIILAVFAICSAVSVKVVALAEEELKYSENLTVAANAASDIAERFKAGQNAEQLSSIDIGREENEMTASLTYSEDGGVQLLTIKIADDKYTYTEITAARLADR